MTDELPFNVTFKVPIWCHIAILVFASMNDGMNQSFLWWCGWAFRQASWWPRADIDKLNGGVYWIFSKPPTHTPRRAKRTAHLKWPRTNSRSL